MSWSEVQSRIAELIRTDSFYTEQDKIELAEVENTKSESIDTPDKLSVLDAANESEYERIREKYQVSVLVGFEHDGNIEF